MADVRNNSTSGPLLSVLVPTFNHTDGLRRIVKSLGALAHSTEIELLVHDDSSDDHVAKEIATIALACKCGSYVRNVPSRGAVSNWNGLLDASRGTYCLLMHHDEYFETDFALHDGLSRLRTDTSIDGCVFRCKVVLPGIPEGRLHLPRRIARLIVEHFPGYILRRNPFGPPSTLMLRRSLYPRFDERLRWLVDCELYLRAITHNRPKLYFHAGPGVISDGTGTVSITKSLGSQVSQIRDDEMRMLWRDGLPEAPGIWLSTPSRAFSFARAVETAIWAIFRLSQRLAQSLIRSS